MNELKKILLERDGLTSDEADELLSELGLRVLDGEDPEELLHDELGLEPDYVFDLLEYAK